MSFNNVGFTQIDVKKTQFTWKIDNFKYLHYCIGTEDRLESPNFTLQPNDGITWKLFLWPNGRADSDVDFLSASLCYSSTTKCNLDIIFSLSVIDIEGKKCYEQTKFFVGSSYDGFNQFLPKKDLKSEKNSILVNDIFTLHCELTVIYKNSLNNVDESIQQQPLDMSKKVLNAFEQQFEKQEFSDVKLVAACGKELSAHKFVLAAHSPVFSAMFTSDMAEKCNNSVSIKDLDYDSLKEMLRFMYAGKCENLDKLAGGILAAQEKYQIDGLKDLCEEYFFTNLNVENAIEILTLSIRYNIVKIKLLVEKFIRCHAKDVSNSAAFKAIDEPKLLTEIVYILANK